MSVSLNISDMTSLGHSLSIMRTMQSTLQNMLDNDIPNLNNHMSTSVNGSAIETHVSNMASWTHNISNMLEQLQTLQSYLDPIYNAANTTTGLLPLPL